jgi:hypothetical protein
MTAWFSPLLRLLPPGLALALPLSAADIVLTDPNYGKINASAIDQPRLYALVSDPTAGDAIITWDNPYGSLNEPVLLAAYIDTGASGVALSRLHATADYDFPHLGLDAADYTGIFTEIGIGGSEVGDVTRPFGVRVRSGPAPESGEMVEADFIPFGDFQFWVRRAIGDMEYYDPINLIGMPVIRQRRLYLDPRPTENLENMETHLLAPGASEVVTQVTIPLTLHDFIGTTPPSGEVLPSHSANPLVPGITLREGTQSITVTWLLDTGAGSSFTNFATAKTIGLIPANYASLAEFMADYDGPTAEIGGIGATQVVPILNVDRISVPSREGATIVWENVDILVTDVASLDGIFGMNLLVPAATIDPEDPLGSAFDFSPLTVDAVVIDTTNAADPVMRLATGFASGTVYEWLGSTFSASERSDPAVGSLSADADGDGLANLVEYALGLDARAASGGAAPEVEKIAADGGEFLALSFSRPVGGAAGVNTFVEVSNDLQTWRRGATEVVLHQTVTEGDRETLTYRAAAPLGDGSLVFLRLVAEPTP